MGIHRISAGHGYTYLTSQTMAHDGASLGRGGLAEYYSERGEAPGRWVGRGLEAVGLDVGDIVLEEQMIALFAEGRHPRRDLITTQLRAAGVDAADISVATELGRPFDLNTSNSAYRHGMAQLAREWNLAQGHRPDGPLPDAIRSRIRTAVGGALFAEEHGREARDARELSDFIAVASRRGSKAVAGFDLTFSPVKSVSALWALADAQAAREIEAAHDAAVRDTIAWLEDTASYTRLGRNGVRQVETRGLLAAAFVHRSSRAGDPDLHTHVAVSNKVQTLDGRWRALDGRVLFKATVAASERYNTRLELELRERLGVTFTDVERRGRRPVREIEGIDADLLTAWSSRRAAIDVRREDLASRFQREHGRAPTPVEAMELAQQATVETRPAKPACASEATQRVRWRAEASSVLGSERAVDAMVRSSMNRETEYRRPVEVRRVAFAVIDRLASERATWQQWHVLAEAQRALRREAVSVRGIDDVVAAVVDVALNDASIALSRPAHVDEPAALRRTDGASVYSVAGAQLYSSQPVLAAEQAIVRAARKHDGRRVPERIVDGALLESEANGLRLNTDQLAFVRALTTSGARCQLALAPAGTGKTTALRVVANAWAGHGGAVLTLAPSAAAARVLGDALDSPSDTLAKAIGDLNRGRISLDPTSLVIVDEAGMAGTPELARLTEHVVASGASLRLIGDDRQLAAVGAGGVLRDLAESVGAATLTRAMRFTDPLEADAATLVRRGASDGLDFYLDHGRVSVGDDQTALLSAFEAWAHDRERGLDSLLLASTRDEVRRLNDLAQARLRRSSDDVRSVRLANGTAAHAGDVILTRRNDRRLAITATDWVKNGDRWTVDRVLESGDLQVTHHGTGRHVVLPSTYASQDVDLGYATTIHGAQGATADSCHVVVTAGMSREQLYVALTRGREHNGMHVAVAQGGDEHAMVRRETALPPSARDILEGVLANQGAARSGTTAVREMWDPARRLHDAAAQYVDAIKQAPPHAEGFVPSPLPWLPDSPRPADRAWARYLDERAALVTALAAQVRQDAAESVARARPGSALSRQDPELAGEFEVFRAVHGGAARADDLSESERGYLRALEHRIERQQQEALRGAERPCGVAPADRRAFAPSLAPSSSIQADIERLMWR